MEFDWEHFFTETHIHVNQINGCSSDTNVTGEITIYYLPFLDNGDGTQSFIYFNWETALLRYLTCSLKLIVHSHILDGGALDQLEQGISLQNIGMRDDINWLRGVEYLPKDLNHGYTILTSVRAVKDKSYFRFISAFETEVWAFMLGTVIVLSILWASYQEQKYDKLTSMVDVAGPLFAKEIHQVKKLKNILRGPGSQIRNYGLIIWSSLWLFMAFILSHCFSGQVTTNLFQMKVYPIVQSIEDLLAKKEILIYTPFDENSLDWFRETKPDIYNDLQERIKRDNELLRTLKDENKDNEEFWVKGISGGKYVYFEYEGSTQNMRHQYSGRYPNLYLSDYKYYYDPQALIVGRRHPFSKKILVLFRIAFENGLYIHQKMQTDKIFLGTFDTAVENKKFSLELEDKSLELGVVLRGSILVWTIFLFVSFIIFLYELCEELPKFEKDKKRTRLFSKNKHINRNKTFREKFNSKSDKFELDQNLFKRSNSMTILYPSQFNNQHFPRY